MDLKTLKTKSGKTIQDFTIPKNLLDKEQEMIMLIMRSEAMNDEEKQYWFTLTEVMNPEQMAKLYDILRRERKKLDEIEAKYGKKEPVDPVLAQKQANEAAQKRQTEEADIKAKEKVSETQEKQNEEAILKELDQVS